MSLIAEFSDERGMAPGPLLHTPAVGNWRALGAGRLLLGFASGAAAELADDLIAGRTGPSGSWTLVARDGDELVIRCDRFGTRPLFHTTRAGRTLVADDIWSVLDGRPALDPLAVADFLFAGYGIGDRTVFEGVRSTQPDALLRIGPDGVRGRMLDLPPGEVIEGDADAAAELIEQRLAALLAPYSDLPRLLVPLSGGLDSRVLLAVAAENGFDAHAWTFVARDGTAEERIAREVARTLGVPQTLSRASASGLADPLEFVAATSGQLSLEHIHGFGAHREAPPEYAVEANGIWGDIMCGGSKLPPAGTPAEQIADHHANALVDHREPADLQRLLPGLPDWEPRLRSLVGDWWDAVGRDPRRADLMWARNRTARFNVQVLIAAARDGLDYIAPFLDDEVMRVSYGIDERWQRDSVAYRRAICRRWPQLGRIPWQKTGLPLDRMPGRREALIARARRRLGLGERSSAFTHESVYTSAFALTIANAERELRPQLEEIGIDLRGMLEAFPDGSAHGGALRLRVATLALALHRAREEKKPVPEAALT